MRVQISPGAFSQCVGIWNTRLIQNQLLNKKRASSNLVTAIFIKHKAAAGKAMQQNEGSGSRDAA